ncbi:hypothetical protein N7453_002515 [Penicillium expansum]|nr:hypothetical protein N7453_002515 [Penicillium expansum]
MSFVEASSEKEIGFDQDQPLVFFGYKSKNKREMIIAKFSLPLRRVQDKYIYLEKGWILLWFT